MKRLVFSLALVVVLSLSILGASAAETSDIITEDDIVRQPENTPPSNAWVLYTRNAGTGEFRVGPATPPAGVGSLEFTTPTGADKVFVFNYEHIGTRLDAIDAMSYATYRTSGGAPNQVPAVNIEVDYNGAAPGGFTTLVFEPVYNTSQGAIVDGQWQTWDAYNGGQARWWSTKNIPGVCAFDCFVTWDAIVEANPEATILGGFGLNQGSGNPALLAAVDVLTIGDGAETVTYDFEPYEIADDHDDCKNGGWKSMRRADGSSFKNQGDCIQYVNTGK